MVLVDTLLDTGLEIMGSAELLLSLPNQRD